MELVGSGKCRPRLRRDVPLLLQTAHPRGLPVSPAASCRSWSSGKTLQQPKSSSILFLTRRILPASVLHPRGQRLLLRGTANQPGRLPEQRARALAAARVLCAMASFVPFFVKRRSPQHGELAAERQNWLLMADLHRFGAFWQRVGVGTCRRDKGLWSPCELLTSRWPGRFYFEIAQIPALVPLAESSQRSERLWLWPRWERCPGSPRLPPAALKSSFLLANRLQMRLESLSRVGWVWGQNASKR